MTCREQTCPATADSLSQGCTSKGKMALAVFERKQAIMQIATDVIQQSERWFSGVVREVV